MRYGKFQIPTVVGVAINPRRILDLGITRMFQVRGVVFNTSDLRPTLTCLHKCMHIMDTSIHHLSIPLRFFLCERNFCPQPEIEPQLCFIVMVRSLEHATSIMTVLLTVFSLLHLVVVTQSLIPVSGPVKVGSLVMSPIGCGTWAWGNRFLWGYETDDDESLKQAFNFVVSKGVTWFDTADSYGTGKLSGRSETLLGQFLSQIEKKEVASKVKIITKLAPFPWRIGEESMIAASKESILRLGKYSAMYQLHNFCEEFSTNPSVL